jgi:hypothetical protein
MGVRPVKPTLPAGPLTRQNIGTGAAMRHDEELYYLDVLYHYLADQYARTHDPDCLQAIAVVLERTKHLLGRPHSRAA